MRIGKKTLRLQTTITLMIFAVVALMLLVVYLMFGLKISGQTKSGLEQKALSISRTVAHTPLIIDGLSQGRSSEALQSYADEIGHINDMEYVVVMDMEGIRYTHPDKSRIGGHFTGGDETEALHGHESVSVGEGSLGKAVRAFSPVFGADGVQLGAVAVGLSLEDVNLAVKQSEWMIYWGVLIGGLMGAAGALLLARKIKRMMFGMEPGEIARLLQERSAILQSAREGILAVDRNSRITLLNAEARRLLTVEEEAVPQPLQQPVDELWPALRMDAVLRTGEPIRDMEIELGDVTLLANVVPVQVNDEIEGAVATFRDKTEITQLMERLSGISLYAEALRAQTHEFMNKLHVILGLAHMGSYDRLEAYIAGTVTGLQTEVGAVIRQVKDQVMAGFLLGKLSRAREAGIRLVLLEDGMLPEPADPAVSQELVTIVGNLLDNAMEAPEGAAGKSIHLGFQYREREQKLVFTISDNGCGISEDACKQIYDKGYSTKGPDRGIGLYLVSRSLQKLKGSMTCESGPGEGTKFVVEIPYPAKGAAE